VSTHASVCVGLDEGLHDEQFIADRCENFEEFKESLDSFDLDFVEQTTGVPREKLVEAARAYATKKPSSICYAMGITQHTHGTDNVMATANLAMPADTGYTLVGIPFHFACVLLSPGQQPPALSVSKPVHLKYCP